MAFVPFWPEDGYRFCPPDYSLKSGMVFKGTTIAYEPGIFACNMFSVKYYYMIQYKMLKQYIDCSWAR